MAYKFICRFSVIIIKDSFYQFDILTFRQQTHLLTPGYYVLHTKNNYLLFFH